MEYSSGHLLDSMWNLSAQLGTTPHKEGHIFRKDAALGKKEIRRTQGYAECFQGKFKGTEMLFKGNSRPNSALCSLLLPGNVQKLV